MAFCTSPMDPTSFTPRIVRCRALANEMTPFRPYRHRVDILADGQVLNWPILLSDIERQSRAQEIFAS